MLPQLREWRVRLEALISAGSLTGKLVKITGIYPGRQSSWKIKLIT